MKSESLFPSSRPGLLLACGLLALPVAAAHAEDLERVQLEPMVVVASRYEQPMARTPASVTVIDEPELARHATRGLNEILAVHGVTVSRSGGVGQNTSVFLRGTNSNHVLVVIDGVPFKPGTLGTPALQNIRGADVERIEILRGPASTMYGSQALGGVIAISTRQARGSENTLALSSGSDNTNELRASTQRRDGDARLFAGFDHFRSEGSRVVEKSPVAGAHENTSVTFNATDTQGDTEIGMSGWLATGSTRYVDIFALTPLNQSFDNHLVTLHATSALAPDMSLTTRLGTSADEIAQQEPNFLGAIDYANTRRHQLDVELTHQAEANTLVLGATAEREVVDALSFGYAINTINDNRAVFVRNDWSPGDADVSLALRNTHYDNFGEHWSGQASLGYSLADTYGWLGHSRGFRAPDASDRFGYGGNPALEPEKSSSYELGLRRQLGKRQQVSVVGFRQDVEDLMFCEPIIPMPAYPLPDCLMKNLDQARITGTEIEWRLTAGQTQFSAMLTLQDPVNDTTGARLLRRPEKQFSATAAHRREKLEYRASLVAMDDRQNTATQTLQGYTVLNLGLGWFVSPSLTLDARFENVGDARYAMASSASAGDYLMPGRGAFVGVTWQPGKQDAGNL